MTYPEFLTRLPGAARLVLRLASLLGRHGQCGTLNPAIGYALRQKGVRTPMVTGEISRSGDVTIEAGYHLWVLAADEHCPWHVDAANPFLTRQWYRENLSPELFEAIRRGRSSLAPPIPMAASNLVRGSLEEHGIVLTPGTLRAQDAWWDVLDEQGKRELVRAEFAAHGFRDPHDFAANVLEPVPPPGQCG